jgi:hypothetical protein
LHQQFGFVDTVVAVEPVALTACSVRFLGVDLIGELFGEENLRREICLFGGADFEVNVYGAAWVPAGVDGGEGGDTGGVGDLGGA